MEKRLIEPSNNQHSSQHHQQRPNMKAACSFISDEKRQQLWLSDLCVKYGELSVTPSASSLSSTCYSSEASTSSASLSSATDYEVDQILLADHTVSRQHIQYYRRLSIKQERRIQF